MKNLRLMTTYNAGIPGWGRIKWRDHARAGQPAYTPFTPAGDGKFVINDVECLKLVEWADGDPMIVSFEELLHDIPRPDYYKMYQDALRGVRKYYSGPIYLYGLFITTKEMLLQLRDLVKLAGTLPIDGYLEVGHTHPGRLPTYAEVTERAIRVARWGKTYVPDARRDVWIYNGYVFTQGELANIEDLRYQRDQFRKTKEIQGVAFWTSSGEPDQRIVELYNETKTQAGNLHRRELRKHGQ